MTSLIISILALFGFLALILLIVSRPKHEPRLRPIPMDQTGEVKGVKAVTGLPVERQTGSKTFTPESLERIRAILQRTKIAAFGRGVLEVRFADHADTMEAFHHANRRAHVGSPACKPCHNKAFIALHCILKEHGE